MKIKIFLLSILFLLSSNFAFAYDETDLQDINIDKETIINSVKEEAIPIVTYVFEWFKENIWPDIEEIINNLLTAERKEELSKETEEVKEELPGVIQSIVEIFKSIKGGN
jgi:hypothetical protein